jgi:hypothetical protein
MSQPRFRLHVIVAAAVLLLACLIAVSRSARAGGDDTHQNSVVQNATQKVQQGEQIFRFDTFGDEAFWGDTLKLHQAIEGDWPAADGSSGITSSKAMDDGGRSR